MWEIIHWYFLYMTNPHALMHLIGAFSCWALSYTDDRKISRRDLIPAIGIFGMYVGFHLCKKLIHWSFQPWWVVSVVGLREKECFIWFGGIFTGIFLLFINQYEIIGHVIMNIGRAMYRRQIPFKLRSLVHMGALAVSVTEPNWMDVTYIDLLAGLSAVLCGFFNTFPDWFSLFTVFSSPLALSTIILHILVPNWFKLYRNNHFKIVKNSSYFIVPTGIVLLSYGLNVLDYLPDSFVFLRT